MRDSQLEQFKRWIDDPMWSWYNKQVSEMRDGLRQQADIPGVEPQERLWLLAKAQGIDEALKQPDIWLGK